MQIKRNAYLMVVVAIVLGLALASMGTTTALAAPPAAEGFSVVVQDDDDFDEPEDNPFCEDYELTHPVGAMITATYSETVDVDYEAVMDWFCGGLGFGQIMLALQTETLTGDDASNLLDRRLDGEGWGQIWQDAELIGRPEDAGPPEGVPPGPPDGIDPPGPPEEGEEPGPPDGIDPPGPPGEGEEPGPPDGIDPPGPPEEGEEPGPPDGIDPPGPPEEGEEPGPPDGIDPPAGGPGGGPGS